jgi:hypothetical protein
MTKGAVESSALNQTRFNKLNFKRNLLDKSPFRASITRQIFFTLEADGMYTTQGIASKWLQPYT